MRDPQPGKHRRTRLLVMTLGHSRKAIRLLVLVVPDDLREDALTDIHHPRINPLYGVVLKHYGTVTLPCRVQDPDRKANVESAVGHVQKTPLKGQRFESLEQAQAYLDHWGERRADARFRGTTNWQVAAMFAEEKPALLSPHVRLIHPLSRQFLREHLRQQRGRHRIQEQDRREHHRARNNYCAARKSPDANKRSFRGACGRLRGLRRKGQSEQI